MKRLAILTLSAMIPLAATLAQAGEGHGKRHGGWHHGGERFERKLDELGLEPSQKEKVEAIFAASKKDREANRAKVREAYQELHSLLEQETPDTAAIDQQVEKIGDMKTEEHKSMLHTLLAVRAELTPEQRAKLKEMKRERGKGRGHHHEEKEDSRSGS
jgi:Spy/CpxP family protein refolding chaperone